MRDKLFRSREECLGGVVSSHEWTRNATRCGASIDMHASRIYICVWIKTKTKKNGRSLSMDLHAVLRMRGELNVTSSVMTRGCHKTLSHAWLPLRIVPLSSIFRISPSFCSFVPRCTSSWDIFLFLSIGFWLLNWSLNSNGTRNFLWICYPYSG